MLRFNTFRSKRYLRSKFVEGKFLLASEATDLELELLDQLRKETQAQFGDIAIGDAWSIQRLNATQILIKPGEAFFKGLPFSLRDGKDQLVTGAVLSVGTVPVGVTASDDSTGLGKIITFNNAASTPTNVYKVVVTAKEELITEVEDPFLQNSNLTEATAQKIRLLYQVNIIPNSLQTETPIPYRDENSTSGSVTNFPSTGASAAPNMVNQTTVTPTAAGNGELISLNLVSGSEGIDGRDVELILRNDGSIGGGIVLPNSPTAQQFYYNGKLIDSNGGIYHINAVFNDTVSTQVVLRIDKEPDQPNPQIINTKPFTVIKRDVFVTDDSNGTPQGKLHWSIATIDFNTSSGIVHQSKIVDLRSKLEQVIYNQKSLNKRVNVAPLNTGNISWNSTTHIMSAASTTKLFNGIGTADILSATSYILKNDSCLAFTLKYDGSTLNKGNLAITISSVSVNTATLSSVDLSSVELGNVIKDSAGAVFYITAIDDVNNTITLDAAPATGAATVYMDSYQEGYVKDDSKTYIFAVRYNNKLYVADLELESGETSQIGDGVSQQLLTFIGATSETDSSPNYSGNTYVTDGDSLVTAIGKLDTALNDHVTDPVDAHDASAISNVPSGNLAATDVQSALNELQSDIDTRTLETDFQAHLNDTTDAHDASAISVVPVGTISSTDVQSALAELDTEKVPKTTQVNAGTGLTGGGDLSTNRTISMPNVGTAGTYGSATQVPVLTTDAQGRVSNVTNTPINGVPAANITNTPSGNLSSTDVQSALNELQTDVDTRQARSTLTTKGDTYVATASATTTRQPVGVDNSVLTGDSAQSTGLAYNYPVHGEFVWNAGLSTSVSANALTINLLTASGNTASSTDPVKAAFRSTTLTNGTLNLRKVTGALSVTVPSGATLGHANGISNFIYVYLVDDAGTLSLAVSTTLYHDSSSLVNPVALSGSSTSPGALYATASHSNVPYTLIGRFTSTQTTAGTWAVVPQVALVGQFGKLYSDEAVAFRAHRTTAQSVSVTNGAEVSIPYNVVDKDTKNSYNSSTGVYTIPITGWYRIQGAGTWNSGSAAGFRGIIIKINSTSVKQTRTEPFSSSANLQVDVSDLFFCTSGDTVNIIATQNSGGTIALNTTDGNVSFQDIFSIILVK